MKAGITEPQALGRGISWQAHGEYRAFAGLARDRHVPTHHARELAGDGKPKPRAAVALCRRGLGLGKFLKQLGLLLGRHADTSIHNGELEPAASVRHFLHPQSDVALLGELAGIAEE